MKFDIIEDIREDMDYKQSDIAKVLDISQSHYSEIECGKEIIPLKHLNKISNFYGVSMDYLVNLSSSRKYDNLIFLENLDKIEIGKRIKYIRKINNLSNRDLAKILNTTSSTISAYETGKTLILTAFAYQICKKYNVSLDWLCGKINSDEKIEL